MCVCLVALQHGIRTSFKTTGLQGVGVDCRGSRKADLLVQVGTLRPERRACSASAGWSPGLGPTPGIVSPHMEPRGHPRPRVHAPLWTIDSSGPSTDGPVGSGEKRPQPSGHKA